MRAMWVTRFDYRSPADIKRIMTDCQSIGLNSVVFQVRGNGTAFYRSEIEPWADELGGADPGFDPLAVAVTEAHARNLELHAWANVMPAWRGTTPPSNPRQLYNAHPAWFWYDQKGRRQPLGGFYVSLNPCLPEVREYLVSVFREIVSRYEVDGLHLDYIRFPNETAPAGVDYPYDARTLSLYRSQTGRRPEDDAGMWNQWRTDQVSAIVRDIRAMMKRSRPGARLSASVGPDPARARAAHFQDGAAWARYDWVDFLCPMNYTEDQDTFVRRAKAWRAAVPQRPLVMGVGIYMHKSTDQSVRQIELADGWGGGFCLFSYSSLFGRGDGPGSVPTTRREARLAALRPVFLRLAARG